MPGYAVGASAGYIYLNDRYVLAAERVDCAIKAAEKAGLLGKNIMGSGFSFTLKVKRGGGAYVCGEETALLNALGRLLRRTPAAASATGSQGPFRQAHRGQQS